MNAATVMSAAAGAVIVMSDAIGLREELAGRLAAAGLAVAGVTDAPPGDAPVGSADVLVLASRASAPDRIRAVETTVVEHAGTPLVALMPDDATGTQLRRAMRAGANGIVLDGDAGRALAPAVLAVAAGQLALPAALGRRLAARALSHREKEILGLVVRGLTNRQIADTLFLAESTVKTHLSSAFGKLDARSRAEAAAMILDPDEGYGLWILTGGAPGDLPDGPEPDAGRKIGDGAAVE